MKLSKISTSNHDGITCLESLLIWENSQKPPFKLFIETEEKYIDIFWSDANGFLLASILTAWHFGEKKIKVDGQLCPVLCGNLKAVNKTLKTWYPEEDNPIP
jgi:hypothetical protein